MSATTTDPMVVFAVVFATSAGTLLTLLLVKLLIDTVSRVSYRPEETSPAPARSPATVTHRPSFPPADAPHDWPAVFDDTPPLTTVTAGHGRHRKDASWT
ncbi:hypothetical protein [Streptomyces graminilatus]|uniref:hypothetical protein n=1 Tax=Streptomyces graminilatus TaxID=1464070 RepID=UPI0012FF342F|nr:hypothetical protein [Streptomyces graminilatus]